MRQFLFVKTGSALYCTCSEQAAQATSERSRTLSGGHTSSKVVLGGQCIAVKRPRVRAVDTGEMRLPSFEWAAAADPLDRATMHAVAAGVFHGITGKRSSPRR
jgi:hypothetical protein